MFQEQSILSPSRQPLGAKGTAKGGEAKRNITMSSSSKRRTMDKATAGANPSNETRDTMMKAKIRRSIPKITKVKVLEFHILPFHVQFHLVFESRPIFYKNPY